MNAERLARILKVALFFVGALIVSPIIFLAIKGAVGLIIAGGIAALTIALAPVLSMKLANWRLKGVMAEASRNPVETRWNIYKERLAALENFAAQIEKFTSKLGYFETQLAQLRKDYPDEVSPFERMVMAMTQLKRAREEEYLRARDAVAKYKRETEKAERIWNMALSARDLGQAANMKIDVLKEIAEKTALNAVEVEMNASFAQLDRLMLERVEELPAASLPLKIEATQRSAR